jgi:translation elongation factor EF-Tu-like GTPase
MKGGRHTPFIENYATIKYSRTMDVSSTPLCTEKCHRTANRSEGMIMPGDNVEMLSIHSIQLLLMKEPDSELEKGGKTAGTELRN